MDGWVQPASWSGKAVGVLLDEPWPTRLSIGSHGYAQVCLAGQRVALLHRVLLGLQPGDKLIGDHINGNPLDCRRGNLRAVTASESSSNVRGRASSGHRGVSLTRHGKWVARGKYQDKKYHLGTYDTAEEAAAVSEQWRIDTLPGYISR
jgi:hypothetical protein